MLPGRKSSGALSLLELPVFLTADSAAVASADACNARLLNPAVLEKHPENSDASVCAAREAAAAAVAAAGPCV